MLDKLPWIFLVIAFLVGVVVLNRRRRPSLQRAHAAFDRLTQTVGRELEVLSAIFDRSTETLGSPAEFRKRNYKGESQELGEQLFRQIEALKSMSAELQRALSEGDQLLHPGGPLAQAANMLTTSRYLHCLNLVEGKSVQLLPFPGDDSLANPTWVTFDTFLAHLVKGREAAQKTMDRLGVQLSGIETLVSNVESKMDQLEACEVSNAILERKLMPALESSIDDMIQQAESDPVGAKQHRIPEFSQLVDEVLIVAKALAELNDRVLPQVEESRKRLESSGYATRWIDRQTRALEDRAGELFETATRGTLGDTAVEFRRDVAEFSGRMGQIEQMVQHLEQKLHPNVETLKQECQQAREQIAQQLGLSASLVLRETGYCPDDELQRAAHQLIAAKSALQQGNLSLAQNAVDAVDVETDQAQRLIKDSLQALDEFSGKHQIQLREFQQIKNQLSLMDQRIDQLQREFDPQSLVWDSIESGTRTALPEDAPDRKGETTRQKTIVEICDELQRWQEQLNSQFESSDRLFRSGKVLEGCNLMELLGQDLADLGAKLKQLEDQIAWINGLEVENQKTQQDLEDWGAKLQSLVDVQQEQDLVDQLQQWLAQVEGAVEVAGSGSRKNPVAVRRRLEELRVAGEAVQVEIEQGSRMLEELQQAVTAAQSEHRVAHVLLENALNDGVEDSAQIVADQQAFKQWSAKLEQLSNLMSGNRRSRDEVERMEATANQIHAALGMVNARLRGEIKSAERAVAAIEHAAQKVFEATRWRGAYNIVVVGRPGFDSLENARRFLAEGKYQEAAFHAQEACRQAEHGLIAAQAQVTRQRRVAVRRARDRRLGRLGR